MTRSGDSQSEGDQIYRYTRNQPTIQSPITLLESDAKRLTVWSGLERQESLDLVPLRGIAHARFQLDG